MPSTTKPRKYPQELGPAIDLLYKLREDRLVLDHRAEAIKSKETELKKQLLAKFGKQLLTGSRGKVATLNINEHIMCKVVDWEKAWKYFKNHPELVQRRVNDEAYREHLELGKRIPGTEPFHATRFSLTKVSKAKPKGAK